MIITMKNVRFKTYAKIRMAICYQKIIRQQLKTVQLPESKYVICTS